jgi:predicted Zn-dependent peptidase
VSGRAVAPAVPARSASSTETLGQERYGGQVRRTVLPSGLTIITEAVPHLRSAAFGVYVAIGSRDESPELAGAAHFLEHLLFKGTERRSSWELASVIEEVGGDTNAYTGKEFTCYYGRVLDRDLPLLIDVMGDMVTSSTLDSGEMDIERGVVLEEISMRADEPDDVVYELFDRHLWGSQALALPVLGTTDSIAAMSRDGLYEFYRRHYVPSQIVVSVAGNLDHDLVVEQIAAAFSLLRTPDARPAARLATPGARVVGAGGGVAYTQKDTDQAHVIFGAPGIDRFDERRYALDLLSQVLGGGMSSRLFQEIREKRGLAYSVYSFTSMYAQGGQVGVYAGCAPSRLGELLEAVREQLKAVAGDGLTDEERARGLGMITGGTLLGLEDSGARMGRLGKGELLYGDYLSVDELLGRVESVTSEQVRAIASELLGGEIAVTVLGPVAPEGAA